MNQLFGVENLLTEIESNYMYPLAPTRGITTTRPASKLGQHTAQEESENLPHSPFPVKLGISHGHALIETLTAQNILAVQISNLVGGRPNDILWIKSAKARG